MKPYRNYTPFRTYLLTGLLLLLCVHNASGETSDSDTEKTLFDYIKGEATENQLSFGMWTFHFTPKSLKKDNWNQNLLGIQYNDFFICAFENSFYNWSAAAGIARNFSTTKLSENWDMNFGYRVGLAYGYKDGEAPFASASPLIPIVEIYNQYYFQKHFGVEIMLTTSLSLGLFYHF